MTYEEMYEKVKDFLDTLNISYQEKVSDKVLGYTLDFYIEHNNNKVAIAVNDFLNNNSTYAPEGSTPKPKKYQLHKSQACNKEGIRLIHAWEHCVDESLNCKFGSWPVLQNCIKSALGIYDKQIYARKTKVVEFPAKETREFFNINNINGYRNATTTYALVMKDIVDPKPSDILIAYSVGHCYFGKGLYDAEIARGACQLNLQVVGGASKLWNYIINNRLDINRLVYYTDNNYYNGNSMTFLSNIQHIKEDVSFWNWHLLSKELKNREPSRHSEIMAKLKNGELYEVCNAGTSVNVWQRNI